MTSPRRFASNSRAGSGNWKVNTDRDCRQPNVPAFQRRGAST
jgi:hypothetical protein